EPELALGHAGSSDLEHGGRRIKPPDPSATTGRQLCREASSTPNVEQARAGGESESVEDRFVQRPDRRLLIGRPVLRLGTRAERRRLNRGCHGCPPGRKNADESVDGTKARLTERPFSALLPPPSFPGTERNDCG